MRHARSEVERLILADRWATAKKTEMPLTIRAWLLSGHVSPTRGARISVDARSGIVQNEKRKQGLGVQQGGQTWFLRKFCCSSAFDNAIEKCYYLADVVGHICQNTDNLTQQCKLVQCCIDLHKSFTDSINLKLLPFYILSLDPCRSLRHHHTVHQSHLLCTSAVANFFTMSIWKCEAFDI